MSLTAPKADIFTRAGTPRHGNPDGYLKHQGEHCKPQYQGPEHALLWVYSYLIWF